MLGGEHVYAALGTYASPGHFPRAVLYTGGDVQAAARHLQNLGLLPLSMSRVKGDKIIFYFGSNLTDRAHANMIALCTTDHEYALSFVDDFVKHNSLTGEFKASSTTKTALGLIKTARLFMDFLVKDGAKIKAKIHASLAGLLDDLTSACRSHLQDGVASPILLMSVNTAWNTSTSVTIVVSRVEHKIPIKADLTLLGAPSDALKFSSHKFEQDD